MGQQPPRQPLTKYYTGKVCSRTSITFFRMMISLLVQQLYCGTVPEVSQHTLKFNYNNIESLKAL
jgi:hypothetical protein